MMYTVDPALISAMDMVVHPRVAELSSACAMVFVSVESYGAGPMRRTVSAFYSRVLYTLPSAV